MSISFRYIGPFLKFFYRRLSTSADSL